jgi:hypothetical protein
LKSLLLNGGCPTVQPRVPPDIRARERQVLLSST